MDTKVCIRCGVDQPITEFYLRNRTKTTKYRAAQCRTCQSRYQKSEEAKAYGKGYRARPENREKATRRHYMRAFGITLEEFEAMVSAQDNRCFLCGVEFDRSNWSNARAPVLDHSHKNDKLRKVLCQICNKSLGFIEQSMDRNLLDRMIAYACGELGS